MGFDYDRIHDSACLHICIGCVSDLFKNSLIHTIVYYLSQSPPVVWIKTSKKITSGRILSRNIAETQRKWEKILCIFSFPHCVIAPLRDLNSLCEFSERDGSTEGRAHRALRRPQLSTIPAPFRNRVRQSNFSPSPSNRVVDTTLSLLGRLNVADSIRVEPQARLRPLMAMMHTDFW